MSLLENAKRFAEKTTGWRRPEDPKLLLSDRKPRTFKFKDDGLIPNHARWPFVVYKSVVRLPKSEDENRACRGHFILHVDILRRAGGCCSKHCRRQTAPNIT
jgi:hypothetical protein